MSDQVPTDVAWRKSSHSNGDGNVCIEVALLPESAAVRDSKNPTEVLVLSTTAWELFRRAVGNEGACP